MPASCETSKNCELIVTYVTLEGSGDVTFTISSGSAGVDQYLGVGLGGTEEMYDANVMFCYALNNGTTDVAMSWNDPSGRASPILEDPTIGLKDQRSKFENGKLGCTFTRDKTSTFKTPSGEVTFDLSTPRYILLAKGPIEADGSEFGFQLTVHSNRLASSEPVDLASFEAVGVSKDKVVRWHGSLMVAAWLFLACTGTMTARYGKKIDKRIMGKDIWFRIHQVSALTFLTITFWQTIRLHQT